MGLPGTGKSSVAEALAQAWDAAYVSSDRLRHEAGQLGAYSPEDKDFIYQLLCQRVSEALERSPRVVADATFSSARHREALAEAARQAGASLRWVELSADEAAIRARTARERPWTEADFSVYQALRQAYEPPPHPFLRLDTTQGSPQAQAARILEQLAL
jgi:predicted kinase